MVSRAEVADPEASEIVEDRFYVKNITGAKVTDKAKQDQIVKALTTLAESGRQGFSMARPKFGNKGKGSSVSPLMGECVREWLCNLSDMLALCVLKPPALPQCSRQRHCLLCFLCLFIIHLPLTT